MFRERGKWWIIFITVVCLWFALLTLPILLKVAQSKELTVGFEWIVNPPGTDGYRLFMGPTEEEGRLIKIIPDRLANTVEVTEEFGGGGDGGDGCQTFYLTAYTVYKEGDENGELGQLHNESGHSDTAEVCVGRPVIQKITQSPEIPQLRVIKAEER